MAPMRRDSDSRSRRPSSRLGTSASRRTGWACRPAAGRRHRALRSTPSAVCALCHGENGRGGPSGPLVGGGPLNSTDRDPVKLIGNYWPYATTIFDFTRRAMPWQQPKTLTDDEVYALTAYILALNKIIGENDVMNAETLPKVKMPNRDGFISKYPEKY
jgi:mono/diheme cytochrome c family protein